MITQVRTPRQRQRFRSACRGKLCLGVTMPQALELFGKSQPGRFFAGPTLALDVGGSTAWLAGHANPDELASFLHFCGCKAVVLDEAECPPPTGRAVVWALEQGGELACTVGAYAIGTEQAYMACGETAEPLRGRGIGGRLIVRLANTLSAQGLQPLFLCSPERVHFYTRLGFEKLGEYARYENKDQG